MLSVASHCLNIMTDNQEIESAVAYLVFNSGKANVIAIKGDDNLKKLIIQEEIQALCCL